VPEQDIFKSQWLKVTFDGIGPIPCKSLRNSGDTQAVSRYRFPRVPGQAGEDLGREPLIISGELLFFASFNPKLYPERLVKVNRAKSEPGAKFFNHPDLGPIEGRFTTFEISYSPGEVNGARVNFVFEEFTDSVLASDLNVIQALPAALQAAGAADAGLQKIGVSTGATTLTADVESLQDIVSLPGSTIQSIQGKANAIRDKVNGIVAQKEMIEAANFEIYKKARAVAAYCQDAAAAAKTGDATQMLPFVLQRDAGPVDLALEIYGDRNKAPEIVAQNASKTFFFGKGRTMYLPDR
jgi:hypothetical protein